MSLFVTVLVPKQGEDEEDALLEASLFMDQNECRYKLPVTRGYAGLARTQLIEAILSEDAEFDRAAGEKSRYRETHAKGKRCCVPWSLGKPGKPGTLPCFDGKQGFVPGLRIPQKYNFKPN